MASKRSYRAIKCWANCLGLLAALYVQAPAIAQDTPAKADDGTDVLSTIQPAATAAPQDEPSAGQGNSTTATRASPARNRQVEEIIVTAQKREENLQDVPISVAAFSADMLDAKGITNPSDLQKVTPGLTYSSAIGFSVIYLRGVGSDAFLMADPSVALYIDGIYYPFAQGLAQNFGALERIEVLKGPQGTLFGRNAVGGAINIITKAPTFDQDTEIQATYGNYGQLQTRAYTNIPLTDSLAFSVSAFYNTGDSYYRNSTSGGAPLPAEISKGARIKARYKFGDRSDVTLAVLRQLQSGAGSLFTPNVKPSLLGGVVGGLLGGRSATGYQANLDFPVDSNLDNTVFYGQLTLGFDPFDIKLLGSHQKISDAYSYDYDGTSAPIVGFDAKNQYAHVTSAELQVLSNQSSWAADRLTWIGGLYYFDSTQGFDPVSFDLAGIDLTQGTILDLKLPTLLVDTIHKVLPPNLTPTGGIDLRALIGTRSFAAYMQTTTKITDWFSVTLGARGQDEKRSVIASSSALAIAGGNDITLFNYSNGQSKTTKSFKPKVSLEFRPAEGVMLYGSFQQALKSSTYNVVILDAPPTYVEPERLTAYEVGAKSQLLDGNVTFNAAAFLYNIKNLQVQFVSIIQGGAVSFQNAGGARVRGVDFDTVIRPLPNLVEGLAITASGAYLDGKFTDYTGAKGYDQTLGLYNNGNGNFTGNQIVRTPNFSGLLGVSESFGIGQGSAEIAGDMYYNTGYFYEPDNSPGSRQPTYRVFNAHLSYLYDPWNLRLTVFGNNLNNEKYSAGVFQNDFGFLSYLSPPLMYGVKANWSFK